MLLNSLLLAISSSIDSLGIGITYGIKNTRINIYAKFILFLVAFTISSLSIYFGNFLKYFLPNFIVDCLGSIIIILMGIFICFQALQNPIKSSKTYKNPALDNKEQIYSFFIKCLGITIKIIKNPISSDLDNSNSIDSKEALFLGFALSLDSFCIGIGFSMINTFSFLFPVFISCFQLFFLCFRKLLWKKTSLFQKITR